MRVIVALQWNRIWEEITESCSEIVFVIKHKGEKGVGEWAVIYYDPTAKDGMSLLDTFNQFETAFSFAEAQKVKEKIKV